MRFVIAIEPDENAEAPRAFCPPRFTYKRATDRLVPFAQWLLAERVFTDMSSVRALPAEWITFGNRPFEAWRETEHQRKRPAAGPGARAELWGGRSSGPSPYGRQLGCASQYSSSVVSPTWLVPSAFIT
jgi:hypothetical protein